MTRLLVLLTVATLALRADDAPTTPPADGTVTAKPAAALAPIPPADDSVVAHKGYGATRYESLWVHSPFSVETPDAPAESVDYALSGIAEVGGVTFASVIEKNSNEHFLISSDKATRGLTLNSITRKDNGDIFADVTKDGAHLSLKLESVAVGSPVMPNAAPTINIGMPGANVTPQIPMPGAGAAAVSAPGGTAPSVRQLIRIHRPTIHVPARPQGDSNTSVPPPPPAAGNAPGNTPAKQ